MHTHIYQTHEREAAKSNGQLSKLDFAWGEKHASAIKQETNTKKVYWSHESCELRRRILESQAPLGISKTRNLSNRNMAPETTIGRSGEGGEFTSIDWIGRARRDRCEGQAYECQRSIKGDRLRLPSTSPLFAWFVGWGGRLGRQTRSPADRASINQPVHESNRWVEPGLF